MTDRDKMVRELHDRHWGPCPSDYVDCPNMRIVEECFVAGGAAEREACASIAREELHAAQHPNYDGFYAAQACARILGRISERFPSIPDGAHQRGGSKP